MRIRTLVIGIALLGTSAIAAAAPPSPELVSRVLKAYGGEAAWKKVAALRQTGKVVSAMQGHGSIVREWIAPDKLRITIDYPGNRELRVVNGLSGSRDGQPVAGPQLDAMILQCARTALPSLLIRHREALRDLGQRTRDGKTLNVIAVPLTTYMSIEIEIDPATARMVRSIGRAAVPGTQARLEFAADYDDFRKVKGLLFAFHEENYASGFHTGATTLAEVEIIDAARARELAEP